MSFRYRPELRPLAGGTPGMILLSRLEYWSDRHPEGFYKFQAPAPRHSRYRKGDSWIEETGLTLDEQRTAFDRFGIRYRSKTEMRAAEQAGQLFGAEGQALYASYFDRSESLTFYLRNHDEMERRLMELEAEDDPEPETGDADPQETGDPHLPQTGDAHFQKQGSPSSVDGDPPSLETGNTHLQEIGNAHLPETGNAHLCKSGSPSSRDGQPPSRYKEHSLPPDTKEDPPPSADTHEAEEAMVQELVRKRIKEERARELVQAKGIEACRAQLDALPFQTNVKAPGSFLAWAIANDRELPAEYLAHLEAEKRRLEFEENNPVAQFNRWRDARLPQLKEALRNGCRQLTDGLPFGEVEIREIDWDAEMLTVVRKVRDQEMVSVMPMLKASELIWDLSELESEEESA
jgi:hypothetical protein